MPYFVLCGTYQFDTDFEYTNRNLTTFFKLFDDKLDAYHYLLRVACKIHSIEIVYDKKDLDMWCEKYNFEYSKHNKNSYYLEKCDSDSDGDSDSDNESKSKSKSNSKNKSKSKKNCNKKITIKTYFNKKYYSKHENNIYEDIEPDICEMDEVCNFIIWDEWCEWKEKGKKNEFKNIKNLFDDLIIETYKLSDIKCGITIVK